MALQRLPEQSGRSEDMTTPTTYAVTDWDRLYENAQSRPVRNTSWFPVSNRCDTEGYATLMGQENGTALYGAWIQLLGVASRMPVRGVLRRQTGPLGAPELAARSRGRAKVFERLLDVLVDAKLGIGWLVVLPERKAAAMVAAQTATDDSKRGVADSNPPTARSRRQPARSPPRLNRTERKGTEKKPVAKTGKATTGKDRAETDKRLRAAQRKAEARHRTSKNQQPVGNLARRVSNEVSGQSSNGEWVAGFGNAIAEAFGPELRMQRQWRSFRAVGQRVVDLPERENCKRRCVALAALKATATGLRNPFAAWQTEVDRIYPRRQ